MMKTWKERVTGDYSQIRGVCHGPEQGQDRKEMEKRLEYAKRLNLNSVRFWLSQEEWEENPYQYERVITDFVESCKEKDISVMPVLWNGNFVTEHKAISKKQWEGKKKYANQMIQLIRCSGNILMWDVFNEPFCNDFMRSVSGDEYAARKEILAAQLREHCLLIRELDYDTPITVGHELTEHIDATSDIVDVICFHDYMPIRSKMEEAYRKAFEAAAKAGGKPVLNTETGCIGRANPYELELEMCSKYHCGFYLFNLMIEGFWGEIHGIVYPDGSVRDPGIVAALYGFRRKCSGDRILPRGNREGHAYKAVASVEEALNIKRKSMFINQSGSADEILDAAEYCIHILETCELVPMWDSLSAKLEHYRMLRSEERDIWELQKFAYQCASLVKEAFLIL